MLIWLLLIIFAPIIYQPGLGGFESGKIGLLLIGGAVLFISRLNKIRTDQMLELTRPKTTVCLIIVGSYLIIRSYFSKVPNLAWLGTENNHLGALVWLGLIILLIITINTKISRRQRSLLVGGAIIATVGMLLIVMGQVAHISDISWILFDDPSRGRTLIGSIGSSSLLGVALALYLIIIGTNLKLIPARWIRFVWVVMVLAAAVILASKSITGIAIIVVITILQLLAHKIKLNQNGWRVVFSLAILFPPLLASIAPKLTNIRFAPSLVDRAELWQAGLKGMKDQPLFGQGPSAFQLNYDRYFPNNRINERVVTEDNPHSLIVAWLVEWGLIGTLLWFITIYYLLQESRFRAKSTLSWLAILLATQLHYLIAPIMIITVINLWLTAYSRSEPIIIHPPQTVSWFTLTLASVWLVITTLLGSSYVMAAYFDHQAGDTAATLDFKQASTAYQKSLRLPFSPAFTQLQFAENYTNLAIQQQNFSSFLPIDTAITKVTHGAPTARNLAISLAVLNEWANRGFIPATKQFVTLSKEFLKQYSDHPRYSELVSKLRQAGY